MLTLKAVNRAIAAKGIKAELVKGDGYYWFYGDDVIHASQTSVCVYRLNRLTLDEWLAELDSIVADHNSRKPLEE